MPQSRSQRIAILGETVQELMAGKRKPDSIKQREVAELAAPKFGVTARSVIQFIMTLPNNARKKIGLRPKIGAYADRENPSRIAEAPGPTPETLWLKGADAVRRVYLQKLRRGDRGTHIALNEVLDEAGFSSVQAQSLLRHYPHFVTHYDLGVNADQLRRRT